MNLEGGNSSGTPAIYCTNIEGFIELVCRERSLDDADILIKVGIDGGGGFFKICLSLFETRFSSYAPPSRVIDQMFLNSSVKRIFILAIAPDVKECYSNVKSFLDLLNISTIDLNYTLAVDLKLANILCGIQAHGSSFPCAWCECPKADFASVDKAHQYPIRSLGSVRRQAHAYNELLKKNSKKAEAKNFQSCIHEPLIQGDDHDIFIRILPPSELHLLLRITNKIYTELQKRSETLVAETWCNSLGMTRPKLHSGEFNGNMCHRLLNNTDKLNQVCLSYDVKIFCM